MIGERSVLDVVLQTALVAAVVGLAANVAFAVAVFLYGILVVGTSAVWIVVSILFILLGALIVLGIVQIYTRSPETE